MNSERTGGLVVIIMGSENDLNHAEEIKKQLQYYEIPVQYRIASAHRTPAYLEKMIREEYNKYDKNNKSKTPIIIITIAGGTDALSGAVAANSIWPVISCPPNPEHVDSCLYNPSGSSNAVILKPANAAKFAAQYFSIFRPDIKQKLEEDIEKKEKKIIESDNKKRV